MDIIDTPHREIVLDAVVEELPPPTRQARLDEPATPPRPAPQGAPEPFSWTAFGGGLAAFVWLIGAIAAPLSLYGFNGVLSLDPALQAGLAALAFGPALLLWFTAAAAGEAVRVRQLADALTRLASGAPLPTRTSDIAPFAPPLFAHAQIDTIHDAISAALNRLDELEASAQRNASLLAGALQDARGGAETLLAEVVRERESVTTLKDELKAQTETAAHVLSRHVRFMREAAKVVQTELESVEDSFETHLANFHNTADIVARRTQAFNEAAESARAAAGDLDGAMGDALDNLTEATKLTDSARRAAMEAAGAAAETANAVNFAAKNAVEDAKRATQAIRAEAEALHTIAEATLARLHEAAEAARAASAESQAAADKHAASIERRLAALAATAQAGRKPERSETQAPRMSAKAPEPVIARAPPQPQPQASPQPMYGFAGWTNFIPAGPNAQPRRATSADETNPFVQFGAKATPVESGGDLRSEALILLAAAGVEIERALDAYALEEIAERARHGASARRRAVAEAAPAAVSRIARYLRRNPGALVVANDFRARPDLTRHEEEGSEVVRAYLLIDAALA